MSLWVERNNISPYKYVSLNNCNNTIIICLLLSFEAIDMGPKIENVAEYKQ